MPAFVGAVKVINMGASSIFHIGDVYSMSLIQLRKHLLVVDRSTQGMAFKFISKMPIQSLQMMIHLIKM
ncbi:hypothetical protein J416_15037 [Gracilibacillus halophilus YIM-C55.5]|uniref:Uncharacterized protein n=1 Tax=Gracilibacillus halophilus YIM-C55.5 TaxID=1308866 RepID=N4WMB8_9BACI|nr:hypothetical protein J416_15037 [Gracilibacillus halophilus YIM-C55.5]